MTKVSDLNVEDRRWPLLVHARKSKMLHISRQNGKGQGANLHAITECNRAIGNFGMADTLHPYFDYKLCPKCGSREDFEEALAESKRLQSEHWEEVAERRMAEIVARDALEKQKADALDSLTELLLEEGFRVERSESGTVINFGKFQFRLVAESGE